MLGSYLIAILALAVVLAAWVAIQSAWRRVFPEAGCDPDALAGRAGCHGCQEDEQGRRVCQ